MIIYYKFHTKKKIKTCKFFCSNSPLHDAVKKRDIDLVRNLLNSYMAKVNDEDYTGIFISLLLKSIQKMIYAADR